MSTEETFIEKLGPCPCGAGTIDLITISPDNPWSRPRSHHGLACDICQQEWSVDYYGGLQFTADRKAKDEKFAALRATEGSIRTLMANAINKHFSGFRYMTRQREQMLARNLRPPNIEEFRRAIGNGRSHAEIASLPGDQKWLKALAAEDGHGERLSELLVAYDEAKHAYDAITVRTFPVPKGGL